MERHLRSERSRWSARNIGNKRMVRMERVDRAKWTEWILRIQWPKWILSMVRTEWVLRILRH